MRALFNLRVRGSDDVAEEVGTNRQKLWFHYRYLFNFRADIQHIKFGRHANGDARVLKT